MLARIRAAGDRGETLLEMVIAIAILGVIVVAVGASFVASVRISSIHRSQAELSRVLHNFAEQLDSATYSPCSTGSPASYSLGTQPGFGTPVLSIDYWTGSSFGSCPGSDLGVQRVKITVSSDDNRATDSLTVYLRQQ